jgi:hypothetical protein
MARLFLSIGFRGGHCRRFLAEPSRESAVPKLVTYIISIVGVYMSSGMTPVRLHRASMSWPSRGRPTTGTGNGQLNAWSVNELRGNEFKWLEARYCERNSRQECNQGRRKNKHVGRYPKPLAAFDITQRVPIFKHTL